MIGRLNWIEIIGIVFVFINLGTLILFGVDKRKAIRGRWRVSERRLLGWAVVAPLGAFIGMHLFRHKTQKQKFTWGVPCILLLHILFLSLLWYIR